MAYVTIIDNEVTGVFANPQEHLDGFQELPDDDVRIQAFLDKQAAILKGE